MKINQKQLGAFKKARREWLSFNEEYNKEYFGITSVQYNAIQKAITAEYGMCLPATINLAAINRRLEFQV